MIKQPTAQVQSLGFDDDLEFELSEIFYSIQGEGTRAGLPCVFVRLQGCTLRCSWCDTKYALDHRKGEMSMTAKDLIVKIESYGCNFVELTGGEPLEQENVYPLMRELCDRGYIVAIETGGHIDTQFVDDRVIRIIDVKCPSSKMSSLNYYPNLERVRTGDEIKFVLANREDYDFACGIIAKYKLSARCAEVILSTSFTELSPRLLAEWILQDHLPVRMQLQMHKFIWDPNARGV